MLCQSIHRGCAGIARQLHPLKAENFMKGKLLLAGASNVHLYAFDYSSMQNSELSVERYAGITRRLLPWRL